MSKKLYFDNHCGMESYAICEDGVLTEYISEPAASGAVVGNIYKGRVTDVLNGMQAAFVDCGLERHCYISVADMTGDRGAVGYGEVDIPATLNLHVGDEIMVQVIKPAIGKKGAKVTTNISFVGKYEVYMPNTPFLGVSLKISDPELRDNMIFSAKQLINDGEGIIVRTAAPYAVQSDKAREINLFRKLFGLIKDRFESAPVGELLYSDSPLHIRILRDVMLETGDEIHVGNKWLYDGIKQLTGSYSEAESVKLILHDEHTDMFFSEGISEQFLKTLQPKAELDNGAYIVIDRTEALTVIDVNTGKYTGEDSLEQTVFSTNVLATREIARQIKLRNLGGLFVVDFIDMSDEKHKKAIVQELEKALKKDSVRCKVLPMSKFGLVEFTRKRTGAAVSDAVMRKCKQCDGTGSMRGHTSLCMEFRARLLQILSEGATTVCADINFDLANSVLEFTELKENISALYPQARVYIIAHRTYREDTFNFRSINSPAFSLPGGAMLLY